MEIYTVAMDFKGSFECRITSFVADIYYILSDCHVKYTHVYADSEEDAMRIGEFKIRLSRGEGKWVDPNHYGETTTDSIPFRECKRSDIPREEVLKILIENDYNISKSAREIGISRKQLYRWIDTYRLKERV